MKEQIKILDIVDANKHVSDLVDSEERLLTTFQFGDRYGSYFDESVIGYGTRYTIRYNNRVAIFGSLNRIAMSEFMEEKHEDFLDEIFNKFGIHIPTHEEIENGDYEKYLKGEEKYA